MADPAAESPSQRAVDPLHSRILLLAGPTATGKSGVAMCLAERLKGEIISVDSMQVYRGMDIGTAKPSAGERQRVPHHLIDLVEVTETFDAARFREEAHRVVAEIQARGRLPILCGGTGLYFRAYLEGLAAAPAAHPTLRTELEATPMPELLRELAERDRDTCARIHPHDRRRVVRALEVIRLTGKRISEQRTDWSPAAPANDAAASFYGLRRPAQDLRARIDHRVGDMFAKGLVSETEALLDKGLAENRNAMQAIGYRQVVEHLQGVRPLKDTIALVKTRTWQFARRQATWFRHQARLQWLEIGEQESPDQVADRLLAELPATYWKGGGT